MGKSKTYNRLTDSRESDMPAIASPVEINIGQENNKVITPQGLHLSNYERIHFGEDPPEDKTMIWAKYIEI